MVGVQIDQLQQNHTDVPGNTTAWRGKEGARLEAAARAPEESRPRGNDREAVPDKARDGTPRRQAIHPATRLLDWREATATRHPHRHRSHALTLPSLEEELDCTLHGWHSA
eukprot:2079416-Rhodomonas_salina.1